MPQDTKDETKAAPAPVGRTYRGESAPPITTPDAVAAKQAEAKKYSERKGAISLLTYFATKGHDSPILQASMSAYTDIRVATEEDFDKIFEDHHSTPQDREAKKAAEEAAKAAEADKPVEPKAI